MSALHYSDSFAGIELARVIEGANARAMTLHTEAALRLYPDCGAAAIDVAGGVASFVGADVPISYAVGLGLRAPVSADEVRSVVDFYRGHNAVPRVDVCPLADESLLDALRAQNFRTHWFVNVLARPLDAADPEPLPEGVTVRVAEPHEAELWMREVDAGFSDGGELTESRRRLCQLLFYRPGMRCYLAEIEGRVAGAGAMFTEGTYAALAATSTRVEFRKRGVHAALIRRRLQDARDLGCALAGFYASPGSTSQRNAERHAFRVVYTKAVMKAE